MQDLEILPVAGGRGRRRRGRRPPNHRGGAPKRDRQNTGGGIYSAPMDHSYRAVMGNNNGPWTEAESGHAPRLCAHLPTAGSEPPPAREDANSRIFAFVG